MGRITSIAHNLRLTFSRKLTDQMGEIERRLSERADRHERNVDLRLDERSEAVERRLDQRLEAHERRTDKYLLQSRIEIIDRADVMLQIFEQRLDRQRREIQAMREALAARDAGAKNSDGSSNSEARPAPVERYPKELYVD